MFQWKAAYAENAVCKNIQFTTIEEIEKAGFDTVEATVPGHLGLDLMREGKLPDLYFSDDSFESQTLENLHAWYFTTIDGVSDDSYLRFEGIETVADIYINGLLAASVDNMFLSYDISAGLRPGKNEIIVHIKPSSIVSRQYVLPVSSNTQKYDYPTLYMRHAPHMCGWDIMVRMLAPGIWKPVLLKQKKPDEIKEVYFTTNSIDSNTNTARMWFYIHTSLEGDFAQDYTVRVKGVCKDSSFDFERTIWHNSWQCGFSIENCKPWWPKNAGEANLYDTTVELFYKGELRDVYHLQVGVRMVRLCTDRSEDRSIPDEFCFEINGRKIFVMGTNWVPLDAFHARDLERLPAALDLLEDIGCNMIRCWGGNVYESDELYDYCDRHGIMVWQDFAMACGVYPQERDFAEKLEREAIFQIKRLRNHPALVLWAGDNECDQAFYNWNGIPRNPDRNFLTRNVLRHAVETHDYARPYLASSPYMGEDFYRSRDPLPEDHLWGPRDYFKGNFYKNATCRFASETGYHGFPSPDSLHKFLRQPEVIWKQDGTPTDEYLAHASAVEPSDSVPYGHRIKLAHNQVVTLFGSAEKDLKEFVKQSQISQAEAKKYFIERYRLGKWERTGIIWWNLLDGWPQVSDAVVDYYYTKKLAYHYIKRSQTPVCLMFDEPQDNMIALYGVNDTPEEATAEYTVTNVTDGGAEIMRGCVRLKGDSSTQIGLLKIEPDEQKFYLITWKIEGREYKNHFHTNLLDVDYQEYLRVIKLCGFDEFEGFE